MTPGDEKFQRRLRDAQGLGPRVQVFGVLKGFEGLGSGAFGVWGLGA